MPSFITSLALAFTLVGCAAQPRTLANTAPAPAVCPPIVAPLLPFNASGETVRYVSTRSGTIEVGLVEHGSRVELVRLVGTQRIPLFVPPLAIAGVPATLTDFDYAIDPVNVEGDTEQFRLVASTSDNQRWGYRATFLFTWNTARAAFDIAAPMVEKVDHSICLPCNAG